MAERAGIAIAVVILVMVFVMFSGEKTTLNFVAGDCVVIGEESNINNGTHTVTVAVDPDCLPPTPTPEP